MNSKNKLETLKDELGNIENTMCHRWASIVRELWGVRNAEEEAAFFPNVIMKTERFYSSLAGHVDIIRMTPSKQNGKAFIYSHGGGWLSPLNRDHVKWAKYFAELTGCIVFAIEYKLCPEHPFPAGLYDIVATHQKALDEGFSEIFAGGDSSGGNLSVALALYARDNNIPMPSKILDICSFHDFYFENYESAQTIGLQKNASIDMRLVGFNRGCYVPYLKDWKNPYASPIYGDLRDFPDTFVLVAGDDPLRDDNIAFAKALEEAGCKQVVLKIYPNMPHSFHCHMEKAPEQAKSANQEMAEFLMG